MLFMPSDARGSRLPALWVMFAVLLTGLVSAGPAQAEPRLRAAPVAAGEHITFGDLFEDAGAAATRRVARAPDPGQTVVFDAPVLQSRANLAGIAWRNHEGVNRVVVSGGDRAPRVARAAAPPASSPPVPAATQAALPAPPREIAVLTRPVSRGDVISAADVMWMDTPAGTSRDALTDAETMIGQTARRNLDAERPLRASDFGPTMIVRRGQPVTLLFESGGLRLTMRGRALADAASGQSVRVTNLASNRVVEAIAEAEGVARVMTSSTSATITPAPGAR
jgi:flagellar basal body P-ring formation protein FlgA